MREARDLVPGYRLCCRRHPELVVIDLKMGVQDLGGLSLLRRMRLRDPRTQILVFSMHDNSAIVMSPLEAGAFRVAAQGLSIRGTAKGLWSTFR